jgi:hypothetical protein
MKLRLSVINALPLPPSSYRRTILCLRWNCNFRRNRHRLLSGRGEKTARVVGKCAACVCGWAEMSCLGGGEDTAKKVQGGIWSSRVGVWWVQSVCVRVRMGVLSGDGGGSGRSSNTGRERKNS